MMTRCKLNIKSPFWNEEDRILEVGLDMKVEELKEMIRDTWSDHPKPEDQRLVYAGKLMKNGDNLRNVLRMEDDVTSYTIHLVRRNNPLQQEGPGGIRKRIIANNAKSTVQAAAEETTQTPDNTTNTTNTTERQEQQGQQFVSAAATTTGYPGGYHQYYNQQQAYWMHQMYAQYVNQYMQYMSQRGGPVPIVENGAWSFPSYPASTAAAAVTPTVSSTLGTAGTSSDSNVPVTNADNASGAPPPAPAAAAGVPNNNPQPDVNPVQQPADNLAGMIGGGAAGAEENDDENGQRDFLDWLYVGFRCLVLFSIVYFYSSFTRFVMVTGIGSILYFYHNYFRRGANNLNNNNNNNNLADPAEANNNNNDNDFLRQQVDEVRQAAGGGPFPVNNNNENEDEPIRHEDIPRPLPDDDNQIPLQARNNYHVSPMAMIENVALMTWNFLSAFFFSLFPEGNNLV